MEALMKIQAKLKAPKGQTNTFGKYKYRSCEDILTALKPLLEENNATLTISDDIVLIGDRYYIKATASLKDGKSEESVCAFARESLDKKGMDVAQITGAASSYARKYALNGMFAIDDTKDPDSFDDSKKTVKTPPPEKKQPIQPLDEKRASKSIDAFADDKDTRPAEVKLKALDEMWKKYYLPKLDQFSKKGKTDINNTYSGVVDVLKNQIKEEQNA